MGLEHPKETRVGKEVQRRHERVPQTARRTPCSSDLTVLSKRTAWRKQGKQRRRRVHGGPTVLVTIDRIHDVPSPVPPSHTPRASPPPSYPVKVERPCFRMRHSNVRD